MTLGELGEEQKSHCPEALFPGQQHSPVAALGLASSCPESHSRPLLPPGFGSQLPLPHTKDTYSQAGRIHPRRLQCPGL